MQASTSRVIYLEFKLEFQENMFPLLHMYNRYALLPLDSLMKLRRRHAGQDQHKTALQEQHKAFMFVHRNIKGTKMIKRVKMKNFRGLM